MKNLIFLVIDSLGNKNCDKLGFSLTPFLDELKQKSLYCPDMYSQAPYTEAAVMSMLCGRETMSEGGYYYRFRDAETLFDYFYKNNYHVVNYIQPHVYPSSIIRSNTDCYYNVCHDFNVVYSYRLSFYAEAIKTRALTNTEYKKIIRLMDDNFKESAHFYESFLNNEECLSLIMENLQRTYTTETIETALLNLKKEEASYKEDKKAYINDVLLKGKDHALFKLPVMEQINKIDDATKKWLQEEWAPVFKDIKSKTYEMNKKMHKFSIHQFMFLLKQFIKSRQINDLKNIARYLKYYKDSYNDPDLFDRLSEKLDNFKAAPSIESHLKHFYNWLDTKKDEPYMACIHVDDIHNPEIFFSYDIEDKDIIKEEHDLCVDILKKCDKTKTGSVTYFLSLAYIDLKIKRFFNELERRGELEDTCIVITGDHGFSFDDVIIRPSRVNNFYLENYQIPFICYGKDIKPVTIDEKCSSKDILPTLLDMFKIKKEAQISGISLLDTKKIKERTIITSEYVGGGCPEMDYREILICAHSEEWLVVAAVNVITKQAIHIKEVYHLKNDSEQMRNLVYKKIDDVDFTKVVEALQNRYEYLFKNYQAFTERDGVKQ